MNINEYKRLRAQGCKPKSALRQARHAVAASASRGVDYGDWKIESTEFDSDSGPYGGYRCRTSEGVPPWLESAAREAGWCPAHLSVSIVANVDEWWETVQTQMEQAGFSVVKAEGVRRSREWRGEYDTSYSNKPEPHSVLFDYSSPRERSDFHWVTYTDDVWNKPTGMSKSASQQWEHRFRVEQAESIVEWGLKVCHNDIQNYSIIVEVLWRGEVVGESACGGYEAEWKGSFDEGPSFEEQIFDGATDLLGEAWDEAGDWVEEAVPDAMKRAAQIVESIALLPDAAQQVVRDSFDRKVINMTAKKEA